MTHSPEYPIADYGDVLDIQMNHLREKGREGTNAYKKLWIEKYLFEKSKKDEAWNEGQNDYSHASGEDGFGNYQPASDSAPGYVY